MEDSFTGIVDVGSKPIIAREAVATGVLRLSTESLDIVKNGRSVKETFEKHLQLRQFKP